MKLIIDIPGEVYKSIQDNDYCGISNADMYNAVKNGTPIPKGCERKFEEIVVEYPPAELCTYPEYKGKPYFSIKYEENGKHIIGFGTYKPEFLSEYLREYFIKPITIEAEREEKE